MAQDLFMTSSDAGMDWEVEHLRLTIFHTAPPETPGEWWEDLVGEKPETELSHPRNGELKQQGAWKLAGRDAPAQLALSISPLRIDWFIGGDAAEQPEGEFRGIEKLGPCIESFSESMQKWIVKSPPANRVAVGAALLIPTESHEAGYRRLSGFLPRLPIDPVGSSDFFYQINRPRSLKFGPSSVTVNRLSRWSVQVRQRAHLTLGAIAPTISAPTPIAYACRLELDINTAPAPDMRIESESFVPLLREMMAIIKEIAQSGDVQ